jgi:MFS superfamily sulfate permease-like transporter
VPLAVVALGILAVAFSGLRDRGVQVIGEIPGGLPHLGFSGVGWKDAPELVPLGMACFMLAFVEGISAARTLALKHRTVVDPEQEMLAVGAANLAAGLGQGYPVAGGMSQSVVNDIAGARTPLAGALASAALALVLLFLTEPFGLLPESVLAALVLLSVVKLVSPKEFRYLYRVSRLEFWVAVVAFGGVLFLGVLQGVLLAVIFSLLLLLKRAARPRVALLGYLSSAQMFVDVARHPEAERIPRVMVLRVEGALLYFNADTVKMEVLRMAEAQPAPLRLVLLELASTPAVDLAGAKVLGELRERLASHGAELRLSEATEGVADLVRAVGLDRAFGTDIQSSAWSIVEAWKQGPG